MGGRPRGCGQWRCPVAWPQWGWLPLCRQTGGAACAARPGLRPVPAHRPGEAAVPQREPRGQRPRRLQAVGGADGPLQGGPSGAWAGGRGEAGTFRGLRPPGCFVSLVPEVKNNRGPIARRFPVPFFQPFERRTGLNLPILQVGELRPRDGKGRFAFTRPACSSRA